MKKNGRKFLSLNITDSMFAATSDGKHVLIPDRTAVTVEDLRTIGDLKTSITHRGLLGSLKKMGITCNSIPGNKFQVEGGDIIYVIIPGGNISSYRDSSQLPEEILLKTVSKWTVLSVEDYENYLKIKNKL